MASLALFPVMDRASVAQEWFVLYRNGHPYKTEISASR